MLRALTVLTASLIVSSSFIVGGMIFGDKLAHEKTVTVSMAPGARMSARRAMSAAAAAPEASELDIVHVYRGCHVWSDGKRQGARMQLMVAAGGRLTITDDDLDPHQLVQLAGPRIHVGKAMMPMGGTTELAFPMKGVYRFKTRTLEMPGMDEVETKGPDNELKLTVNVV